MKAIAFTTHCGGFTVTSGRCSTADIDMYIRDRGSLRLDFLGLAAEIADFRIAHHS